MEREEKEEKRKKAQHPVGIEPTTSRSLCYNRGPSYAALRGLTSRVSGHNKLLSNSKVRGAQ